MISCIFSGFTLAPFAHTELCRSWRREYLHMLSEDVKGLVIRVAVFFAKVYVAFRAVTLRSNITYKDKYAIVKIRDKLRTSDLYIPFRKNLRVTRYEAKAYKGEQIVADLSCLKGIPILVSADELGVDEIAYCMPSSGKKVKSYTQSERPLNSVLK